MDQSKGAVANRLAEAHYAVEPGIELIVRLVSNRKQEADPKEPIKLLEVNEHTTAYGIQPIFFGSHPASGIFFPSIIVEVTPAEYKRIVSRHLRLPNGWRLGEKFRKTEPVAR
jgi:hypothetical protein